MGEMAPSITIVRIILSNCGPLPFGDIRTPFLPILLPLSILFQALLLFTEILVVVDNDHLDRGQTSICAWVSLVLLRYS